ncbi:MAG: 5-methyltetrahydrofolate--homocysteine methyltransferase [Arenicella sp.]|jgi:5-methyltetrahydrofolate--homocysteine methyltransferase
MTNKLSKLLEQKSVLLLDGATGTNLFAMGLQSGDSPEFWNVDHPDKIAKHYQSFIEAGSDVVLTNTFGGTSYRLKLHNGEDRVAELNIAAARILSEEVEKSGREIVIAGSMGPTGEILEPAGSVSIEQAQSAFSEQALALKEGGVDVLWIETISSIEESHAAIRGASVAGLPIVLTLSIDTNGRTMMGVTAAELVSLQKELAVPLIAFGTNCGVGAAEVVAAIMNMSRAAEEHGIQPILVAKGNCGIPEWVDGEISYSGTPELMAIYAKLAMDSGARIIGGCCGTTPVHVASMRAAIDEHTKGPTPAIEEVIKILGSVTVGAQAQLKGDQSVEGGALSKGRRGGRARRR